MEQYYNIMSQISSLVLLVMMAIIMVMLVMIFMMVMLLMITIRFMNVEYIGLTSLNAMQIA